MSRPSTRDFLDTRVKILVAPVSIVGLTWVDLSRLSPVSSAVTIGSIVLVGVLLTLLLKVPVLQATWHSCAVLPFAGGVALFAPLARLQRLSFVAIADAYGHHWLLAIDILFKAYVAAYIVVLVIDSTSIEALITALTRLRVPRIFITLFTFLYRFTDLFRDQIGVMRDAVRSRAPYLHGYRLLFFYGHLSGNLFIRAYERGEQIHSAMLSRGYDGTLPTPLFPPPSTPTGQGVY